MTFHTRRVVFNFGESQKADKINSHSRHSKEIREVCPRGFSRVSENCECLVSSICDVTKLFSTNNQNNCCSNSPGRPRPCALGELGDEAGLLLTDEDDWSESVRKSNEGDDNFGEAGRAGLPSGDDTIRFKELVRRRLDPGDKERLVRRPIRFQKGLCLGCLSPVSGPGDEGRLGDVTVLLPRLGGSFFLTCLLAESTRFRPPCLMDVLASSVAHNLTLVPPLKMSSMVCLWLSPITDWKQQQHGINYL